jgi:DNA-binding MarR family transcriptional regulator
VDPAPADRPAAPGGDVDPAAIGRRILAAWRDLRRGAAMRVLREGLYGIDGDAVDPSQLDTLEVVVQRRSWSMRELATALHVDASTMTRTVDRMEAQGLVARRPHPDDRRVTLVRATSAGRERCADIQRGRARLMVRILEAFDVDEVRRLADLLERLNATVNRMATRSA